MKPAEVDIPGGAKPIGYARLILDHQLSVLPPHRLSFVANGAKQIDRDGARERVVWTMAVDPGESEAAHLEFSVKHDGIEFEVLAAYFAKRGPSIEEELAAHIRAKPTGVFVRRLWFFFEWLTSRRLPLEDMVVGNYEPLLDPRRYFTLEPGLRVRRQRLFNNLLGVREFCPFVRRTDRLRAFADRHLDEEARRLVGTYSEEAIRRATSYLYTRETRSSFDLEHERPVEKRAERFMALLQTIPKVARLDEGELVRIQNATVDPAFAEPGYREAQNFVGETIGLKEKVHYLPPRPQELRSLMQGWASSAEQLLDSEMDAVVHAAALSFSFVFLHPFEDGNGRIHRLLIHRVLSRRGFTPAGLIFPVSAVILRERRKYDQVLEAFSAGVMALVRYELDDDARASVDEDTSSLYRYPDLTRQAEALYEWIATTIETDFRNELAFVVEFQKVHDEIRQEIDMPDRLLRLFVRVAVHNNGRISAAKRGQFVQLTDEQVAALEAIIQKHLPVLTKAAELA